MNTSATIPGGCPDGDVIRDYVLNRLAADSANAFEPHYFDCDRCWLELKSAIEVRAALIALANAPVFGLPTPVESERIDDVVRPRTALLLVALLAVSAYGAWRTLDPPERRPPPKASVLGETTLAFDVRVDVDGERIMPTWPRVPGARLYTVELVDTRGDSLHTEDTAKTRIAVSRQFLPDGGLFYCAVKAFDESGQLLVTSKMQGISLTAAESPAAEPAPEAERETASDDGADAVPEPAPAPAS